MQSMLKRLFLPITQDPSKLCKNCAFFRKHDTLPDAYGYCAKKISLNMVDGNIKYRPAGIVRDFECHGRWWEPAKSINGRDDSDNLSC